MMPAIAPAATTLPAHAMPTESKAAANGAFTSISDQWTMPHIVTHMAA
jgi:hypothetical protein